MVAAHAGKYFGSYLGFNAVPAFPREGLLGGLQKAFESHSKDLNEPLETHSSLLKLLEGALKAFRGLCKGFRKPSKRPLQGFLRY